MPSKTDVASFAQAWVAHHVRGTVGLNVVTEVDRLAAHLTADARAQGISGRDLHGALGDIDDYLTGQFNEACRRAMSDDPAGTEVP